MKIDFNLSDAFYTNVSTEWIFDSLFFIIVFPIKLVRKSIEGNFYLGSV